jgi:hypothetical protein
LFTLHFPVRLPDNHTFFDNGQYPVPPLPGGLKFGCISNENAPLLLQISGFATEQDAIEFCPFFRAALRIATLESKHSMTPSDAAPVRANTKIFDGNVPTVTVTSIGAQPYFVSASSQNGLHISVLSNQINDSLAKGGPVKVSADPKLALALELYSDCQFAGDRSAQFIVLVTALEVLVPSTLSSSKRGPVIALVKKALSQAGHPDPKSVGKNLDGLYVARNALIHDALLVTDAQLTALKEIVGLTLKALLA